MQFRYAKKLHNRDQVTVKMYANKVGYILGDPYTVDNRPKVILVDVIVENVGFVMGIPHTELK